MKSDNKEDDVIRKELQMKRTPTLICFTFDYKRDFHAFLYCFFLPFSIFTLIILILLFLENIFLGLSVLVFFLVLHVISVAGFIGYWKRIDKWTFNKNSTKITLIKYRGSRKTSNEQFDFSDVNFLYYQVGLTEFYLHININFFGNKIIYFGNQDNCRKLGIILAEFLNTSLTFKKTKNIEERIV